MSILNEMRILEPNGSHDSKVRIGSSSGIGLVSQQPWIQQGTLRENILMGKSFDWSAYQAAVAASALADDLKNLADGDKTKVAVDAKVARHIFYECILSGMKDKLRILCTHHISYLYEADTVIVMEDGRIVACGPPSDVLPVYTSSIHTSLPSASSEGSTSKVPSEDPHTVEDSKGQQAEATDNEEGGGAIVEEEKDSGTVKLHIYRLYLAAVGTALSLIILLSLFLMQGSKNVTDWWLSYWISNAPDSSADLSSNVSSNVTFYLEVYGGLAVGNTVFTLFRAFVFAYGGLCAAARLHDKLLGVVTLAPVSFFDTTSTGRIINRFSSDVYTVDDSLPFIANILLSQIFSIIGTLVITIYGLPWFAAVVFPITLVYYYIQGYYRHTSRELKRITSVTMSEVYSSLSESVEGRVVIRAFNMNSQYELENLSRIERNQRANFSATAAAQWLNIRLQGLGVVMVTAIALIAVLEHRYYTVNAGLVGLAISYALSITNLLSGVVSSFTETEKQMVSVERINQYIEKINLHSETNSVTAEHDWPQAGRIEFKDVSLRYRSDLPLVLNSLTVAIQPAEKIGIVGRTGSGKSSLLNIIFNMVDEFTGRVLIDGVDIRQLTVKTLRSHLAIIPQTPFLFSGTIRDNLDPTVRHSDTELWEVLSKCRLKSQVSALGGLSASLAERGKLFSVGESQLLCLARAMLLRSKVLCIDEATANVDLQTDSLIQETIREEFQSCTVLTIAHRVSTVLQCDRIMVMSRGRLVEFGVPEKLLANPESQLSSIVNQHSE
ncbi:ABCC10 [Bugula neritina]|uniref:ABCC10 n=1 Tax=Bugula neritina TaxID=10212 RepID=A0A7J7K4T3_BUGNE|nr:ABCC10 [Bugula neritina]